MSSFQSFAPRYRALSETGFLVMHKLAGMIQAIASTIDEDARIQSRFKTASSTWAKMNFLGLAIDEVDDLIGIRVITSDVARCYEVVEALRRSWPEWSFTLEDYIAHPKTNGYKSLHLHVSVGDGLRFEVQVRTEAMQRASEHGDAAHWRYKLNFVPGRPSHDAAVIHSS